ncbi:hypothetical protein BO85DRAFT_437917 [Aspergillus piperis CBS 112811]|uniref:Uncharacterized protein n=1 Tax=Aspergillus piperis CBS 112811 TaxID=1448313 RepID=A0A8G1R2E3_9EURO|nr:hypothetical protein BO85DRAFT_437917 [Aspergillus piperis CBS 112811]RAH58781.1 hypothetical protein BO85DRAFT_437917 [Aspergillus piperis CBS 112811]
MLSDAISILTPRNIYTRELVLALSHKLETTGPQHHVKVQAHRWGGSSLSCEWSADTGKILRKRDLSKSSFSFSGVMRYSDPQLSRADSLSAMFSAMTLVLGPAFHELYDNSEILSRKDGSSLTDLRPPFPAFRKPLSTWANEIPPGEANEDKLNPR